MALPVYYSPTYTAARVEFDTTRKATWVAQSLIDRPIDGVSLMAPLPLSAAALTRVHDRAYVDAVRTGQPRSLAESSGLMWDRHVWSAVRASNGGVVAAAQWALTHGANAGSLSSGLHHARSRGGSAFCTFNGLALAVQAVPRARVLIVDLDAHCGGGTDSIIRSWPHVVQLDISVSAVDQYAPKQGTLSTLDVLTDAADYMPTLQQRLAALDDVSFDLLLYNAGMDPFEGCAIGGLTGITDGLLSARDYTVFDWAADRHVPVAFVLAGGYVSDALPQALLVQLHRMTIRAARVTSPDPVAA